MAVGKRIRYIRNLKNMTQRFLGAALGFEGRAVDVRMNQYETGTRTPKEDVLGLIAKTLGVHPMALDIPDIDTQEGFLHTLFAFEDLYNLKISKRDDQYCITVSNSDINKYIETSKMLSIWYDIYQRLLNGEITEDEYNDWRYNYPESKWQETKASLYKLRNKEN